MRAKIFLTVPCVGVW